MWSNRLDTLWFSSSDIPNGMSGNIKDVYLYAALCILLANEPGGTLPPRALAVLDCILDAILGVA